MRKTLAIIMLLFAAVLLSACSSIDTYTTAPTTETQSVTQESQLPQDEKMMPENVTTAATEFSSQPVIEHSGIESTEASSADPVVETRATESEAETGTTEESVTEASKPVDQPQETEPEATDPVTETKPTEPAVQQTEPSDDVPEETIAEETIPTEPTAGDTESEHTQQEEQDEPEPEFDIDYWIGYAKEYAAAIGLILEPTAVDCWDNPIGAGAHCVYLERDIQSRLSRYARDEDITDVWIWAVPTGDGCYDLYIGYA